MSTTAAIDESLIEQWFSVCDQSASALESQFEESLAALEAYQRHLDGWQQELRRQRQALNEERKSLEAMRAQGGGAEARPSAASTETDQLIDELRENLMTKTEELRRSDSKRAELVSELQLARAKQLEMEKKLESEKTQHQQQQTAWTEEFQRVCHLLEGKAEAPAPAKTGASPVVSSVLAQFGKLRQQANNRRIQREAS